MLNNLKDRLIRVRLKKDERFTATGFSVIGIIIFLLILNLIYLNILFFGNKNLLVNTVSNSSKVNSDISLTVTPTVVEDKISTTPIIKKNNVIQSSNNALIKDYFIPLGSGTSQAGDWEDVPGVLATVDFGQYRNIKEIRLEASVVVPTGNEIVWVRLFNKTDQHPVWYSEVTMNSNANAYLISSPIVYDFGQKLYQVQMKTQLKAAANLVQSRIHVVLK